MAVEQNRGSDETNTSHGSSRKQTSKFEHERLKYPWQLRLVELLPPLMKNRNETVRCRVHVTPGADAAALDPRYDVSQDAKRLPYTALSYCWGNSRVTRNIDLDGQEFHVRTNLFEYLKQRREPTRSVMLWIDAICINQSDKSERSAQVTRMTSIYMNAQLIEIWLGPEDLLSSVAMDELNRLARAVRDARAKLGSSPQEEVLWSCLGEEETRE